MTRPALALIALASVLAGCIPAKFQGYRPSGAGAREGAYCVAGVRDRLRVPALQGAALLLHAEEDPRDHTILLEVSLVVPDGVTAGLVSAEVTLASAAWNGPRRLAVTRITGGPAREQEPLAALTGSGQDSLGTYTLWFAPGGTGTLWRTGIPAPPAFEVTPPPVVIGDESFQAEPVAFEAYTDWGVFTCAQ